MNTSFRHSVIVMVTNGIRSIKIICHTLLNVPFLMVTENAAQIPSINGQKSAKASSSHLLEKSCDI